MIGLALAAFMAVLAWVVGQRLSSESMAVLVGVLAGVIASVPTSLVLVYVMLRGERSQPRTRTVYRHSASDEQMPARHAVIVQAQQQAHETQAAQLPPPGYAPPAAWPGPGDYPTQAEPPPWAYPASPAPTPRYDEAPPVYGGWPQQATYSHVPAPPPPPPRDFTVIGGDEDAFEGD